MDKAVKTRVEELRNIVATLLRDESLLVLGDPGAGKTAIAFATRTELKHLGYTVAVAGYNGSAKETLVDIAEQIGASVMTDDDRPKQKTAQQLREDLRDRLVQPKTLLICDDAHRWSASLRYWLEDVKGRGEATERGGLLLLLGYEPPAKDIFLKLPKLELQPLNEDEVRYLVQQEVKALSVEFRPTEVAEMCAAAGGNPSLARRTVREKALGIVEVQGSEHFQYIDGTPMFAALLSLVAVVRFVGLGLGDKALYVLGGLLTLVAFSAKALLQAANQRGKGV